MSEKRDTSEPLEWLLRLFGTLPWETYRFIGVHEGTPIVERLDAPRVWVDQDHDAPS